MNEIYICMVQLVSGIEVFLSLIGKPREEPDVYRMTGGPCTRKGEVQGPIGNVVFERSKVAYMYYYKKSG